MWTASSGARAKSQRRPATAACRRSAPASTWSASWSKVARTPTLASMLRAGALIVKSQAKSGSYMVNILGH
jgi:hypothetical protein